MPSPPIVVRKKRFPYEDITSSDFYGGNPLISAHIVAMSITFPPGEAAFIRSVRAHREHVSDPELLAQIKQFEAQEGQHAGQHRAINRAFDAVGYTATEAAESFDRHIHESDKHMSPLDRLATTVVMEHITAVLAHSTLSRPDFLEPMPESLRDLLSWHAVEEIEHKAVAFEVYLAAGGSRWRLRRALAVQLLWFPFLVSGIMRSQLRASGAKVRPRHVLGWAAGALGFASTLPHLLSFALPGFHPWDHDDRELIASWQASAVPA